MPTYSYNQIHQLTTQAGYSGTQANAVAHYLYNNQTTDKSKNNPNAAYNSLASRIGKFGAGAILVIIGLIALLREPIEAAAGEVGKFNPAVGAVAGVSRIRQQRATRKLTEVQTARATHALQEERVQASGPINQPATTAQPTPRYGRLGPDVYGRPFNPGTTPPPSYGVPKAQREPKPLEERVQRELDRQTLGYNSGRRKAKPETAEQIRSRFNAAAEKRTGPQTQVQPPSRGTTRNPRVRAKAQHAMDEAARRRSLRGVNAPISGRSKANEAYRRRLANQGDIE